MTHHFWFTAALACFRAAVAIFEFSVYAGDTWLAARCWLVRQNTAFSALSTEMVDAGLSAYWEMIDEQSGGGVHAVSTPPVPTNASAPATKDMILRMSAGWSPGDHLSRVVGYLVSAAAPDLATARSSVPR